MDGRQDYIKFLDVLRNGLVLYASEVFGEVHHFLYYQDNAPIHTSNFTRCWLSEKSISTRPWCLRSPGINIIENVWGVMARMVYGRGKYY